MNSVVLGNAGEGEEQQEKNQPFHETFAFERINILHPVFRLIVFPFGMALMMIERGNSNDFIFVINKVDEMIRIFPDS